MTRNRVHCSICSQNILMGIIGVLNEIFTCIHKKKFNNMMINILILTRTHSSPVHLNIYNVQYWTSISLNMLHEQPLVLSCIMDQGLHHPL